MTVGDRIKEARTQKDISQVDLAYMIGVTKQLLYKYECNIITNIPSDKIELIAKVCGVSPAYLMGWADHSHPQLAPFDDQLLKAYHSASDEAKSIVRYTLKLPEEPADEKTDMIS